MQLKRSIDPRNKSQPTAVGADRWRDVVRPGEGDALWVTTIYCHFVNLWGTTAVTDKINRLTVGSEVGLGINRARLRQTFRLTAIGVHQKQLRSAIAAQGNRQTLAIG